jgi:hypothetical protein
VLWRVLKKRVVKLKDEDPPSCAKPMQLVQPGKLMLKGRGAVEGFRKRGCEVER